MKRSLAPIFATVAMITVLLLSGCVPVTSKQGDEQRNQITQSIEAVDRVTVLAANGQEIALDLPAFRQGLDTYGTAHLNSTTRNLSKSEVRYTLIAYRSTQAPLVMEIGEEAVQYNHVTYQGEGARQFYGFIRQLAGEAFFHTKQPEAVELTADDQHTYEKLTAQETELVLSAMREAEYQQEPVPDQFPLYPHYRLKLAYADGMADAVIVTPSLLAVTIGTDTLYYQINQELFSKAIEWLPVRPASEVLEKLYKASKVHIRSTTAKLETNWAASESISMQGEIQQLVRHLHQAQATTTTASDKVLGQAKSVLTFWTGEEKERTITIYENHFVIDQTVYHRPAIGQNIQNLLSAKENFHSLHENLKNW